MLGSPRSRQGSVGVRALPCAKEVGKPPMGVVRLRKEHKPSREGGEVQSKASVGCVKLQENRSNLKLVSQTDVSSWPGLNSNV